MGKLRVFTTDNTAGYSRGLKCWSSNPSRGIREGSSQKTSVTGLTSFLALTSKLFFNRDAQYCTILEEEVNFTTCNWRRDGLQNNLLQFVIPTRKNLASTEKGCY